MLNRVPHRLLLRFPDGCLWAEAQGAGGGAPGVLRQGHRAPEEHRDDAGGAGGGGAGVCRRQRRREEAQGVERRGRADAQETEEGQVREEGQVCEEGEEGEVREEGEEVSAFSAHGSWDDGEPNVLTIASHTRVL